MQPGQLLVLALAVGRPVAHELVEARRGLVHRGLALAREGALCLEEALLGAADVAHVEAHADDGGAREDNALVVDLAEGKEIREIDDETTEDGIC